MAGLLLLGSSVWLGADALTDEGRKLVRHFGVGDYGAHVNTVDANLLSDGRVLFGSYGGVGIFDGQTWEFLPVAENSSWIRRF